MSATRRQFLRASIGAGLTLEAARWLSAAEAEKLPPVRPLTRGPRFHWFGYYDKLQFDPSSRHVLGMEVSFEHRLPEATDPVRIGLIDTGDRDRWIDLGESYAWCWQQGCMLQWLPGSDREVVFNDRERERFVCRILDTRIGKSR